MSHASRDERGQTALDFAIGMAVFLLAVAFVFAFIPTMFDPFFGTGTSNALIADRSAAQLTERELADDPARAGIMSESTVTEFFAYCDTEALAEVLGIDTHNVQVEIGQGLYGSPCGGEPSSGDSVTVSRRFVSVNGTEATLRVRVW